MNKLRHIGIFVKNMDLMTEFYKKLFAAEITYEQEEKGEYLEILTGVNGADFYIRKLSGEGGLIIELLKTNPPQNCPEAAKELFNSGLSHIAVTVGDLERVSETLTQLGASFISPPQRSPFGIVDVCFCKDPEGNFLELVQDL